MAIQLNDLLWSKPGMNGGRLCLEGTGFSVFQAVAMFKQGYSAEDIGYSYPHLKMSHIYAALAYYLVNREEVDRELAAEAAEHDRLLQEHLLAKVPVS